MNNLSASERVGEMIVELTMIMRLGKCFKTVGLWGLSRELKQNASKASFLEFREIF